MPRWLLNVTEDGDSITSGQLVPVLCHPHSKEKIFFFFLIFKIKAYWLLLSFLPERETDDTSDILLGCPASSPSVRKSELCCHVLADESVACQEGLVSHCYVLNATKPKKHTLQNKFISTLIHAAVD